MYKTLKKLKIFHLIFSPLKYAIDFVLACGIYVWIFGMSVCRRIDVEFGYF